MSAAAAGKRGGVHLRFQVGPRWIALPVQDVFQVAPLQSIREVPRTPGFIRGLMEYQGRLLTVLDAVRLLGDRSTGRPLAMAKLIPDRGAWMEFETRKTDYLTLKYNRKWTVPITILPMTAKK